MDELIESVREITKAINEHASKITSKYYKLVDERTVRRALKDEKLRHIRVGTKYAMYRSEIKKLFDPNCLINDLSMFADHVGLSLDQVKYRKRKNELKWLDRVFGDSGVHLCAPNSGDHYRDVILKQEQERTGKQGRPRKAIYTDP